MTKHISKRQNDIGNILEALAKRHDGHRVDDICRDFCIDRTTFSRWQDRYGLLAMDFYQLKRENEHLKNIYNALFKSHEMLYETLNALSEKSATNENSELNEAY